MSLAQRIEAIDALLPQTQCGKCGHPGCLPYARGMAEGEAINKCPPGGSATVHALADLLRVPVLPLEQPEVPAQLALIREDECIGCTKCIQACPVDAIVGAAKLMHTVIAAECTGCELCVAPCPVDCIDIVPLAAPQARAQREMAGHFRRRHDARQERLARLEAQRRAEREARSAPATTRPAAAVPASNGDQARYKRLKIEAAMARVALAKAEKQFAQHGTDVLRAQVDSLRLAAEASQRDLDNAQPAAPSLGEAALKQAKIALAGRRAELARGQRQGADEATLQALRQALADAEAALHQAEDASGKPPPNLQRIDKRPVDSRLRELKTELAYARADLSRLQRRQDVPATQLQQARVRFDEAQRQLDAHGT